MDLALQAKQRRELDAALATLGRNPETVGILWQTPIVVRETRAEAQAQKDRLLTAIPAEAVGVYISYNVGYDFSTLPERFTIKDLHAEIVASNASPVGFIYQLGVRLGPETEITRQEFFEHALRNATGYDTTIAGSPSELADLLEERFEATGSRGGFMFGHIVSLPDDLVAIVDLLVPELQRRGRFRTAYRGATLRENLLDS
jgi:alkanesulfonate monooxygenase SsuD/methylene tetrahydromethanopterin reductase-like flavin-dependent oxidoreductase (luciferase family)